MADLNYPLRKKLRELRESFRRPRGTVVRAELKEDLDSLTQIKDDCSDAVKSPHDREWNGPLYPPLPPPDGEMGHGRLRAGGGEDEQDGTHMAGDHCQ